MRSTPAARSGSDRPPFECRVRFTDRLANAVLVPIDAPLQPARPRPATNLVQTPASQPVAAPGGEKAAAPSAAVRRLEATLAHLLELKRRLDAARD